MHENHAQPDSRPTGLALPSPKGKFLFDPEPDITALDIAEMMPALVFGIMVSAGVPIPKQAYNDCWNNLPSGAKRHWKFQPKEEESPVATPSNPGLILPSGIQKRGGPA